MKKSVLLGAFIAAILMAFSPQASNAQAAGNEQRLVGSWTCLYSGSVVVFNADGTVTGLPGVFFPGRTPPTHWAAAGNALVLFRTAGARPRGRVGFYISSDGQTLVFTAAIGLEGYSNRAFRRN